MLSAKPTVLSGGAARRVRDRWVITWGPRETELKERIMESRESDSPNEMIAAMIAQLQAFINHPPDEDQMRRLTKASKQLRKMGWPKTAFDQAAWRQLYQGDEPAGA